MTPSYRYLSQAIQIMSGAIMASSVVFAEARAHDATRTATTPPWTYDAICCRGVGEHGDCQDIPASAVHPVPGGYSITLRPGDHRLVTKPQNYSIPEAKTRRSPDGRYHACLYPNEAHLQCFYAPPMSW